MIDALNYASSAMNAFSVGTSATAHNIANVNTAGYSPYNVNYETGSQGYGVRVAEITRGDYGGLVSGTDHGSVYLPASDNSASLPNTQTVPYETPLSAEASHPSGAELSTEFTSLVSTQRAYEAQSATIRVTDQMTGTLLDMMA